MEPSSIIKTLGSVAQAVTKLVNIIKDTEARQVAIELQGVILSLQNELLSMQSEHNELLKTKNELEKELMNFKDWEKTKSQYELKELIPGMFVYSYKKSDGASEPPHWLCTNCYNDGKKSILQLSTSSFHYFCPKCKTAFTHPDSKPVGIYSSESDCYPEPDSD
jgi:hypothetical protein